MVYGAVALTLVVAWFLAKTRGGMILRAVGENHEAAHGLGYNVIRIRYLAVLFGDGAGAAVLRAAYDAGAPVYVVHASTAEAVEAIDPRPVEGIRATGAHSLEEIVFGVIPQVMPLWLSYSLYRFESNVRSATVLGIVGAGGIGLLLWDAMRNFEYTATAAILVIIIVVVSILDLISSAVRKAFI